MQISCLQDININRTRVQKLAWHTIGMTRRAAAAHGRRGLAEPGKTENLCDVTYLAKSGSSALVKRSAKLCSATADTSDSP